MKTTHKILLLAGLISNTAAFAQSAPEAYVTDSRGVIARSGTGLCWRTGYWTPAMANAECEGDLVRKADPAPAPAPTPQAKKCDFTVTLQNEETFEFNKAVLRDAARTRLDQEVLGKLATCSSVSMVLVTGHTDRLGTHPYNQQLSEKRADVVKAYLAGKGLAADSIDTMGAGKTQPVKSCSDKAPRKEQIDCLAPNRRVTIEVRGTAK